MENKKAIICWVHSEDSSFQVDICPEKTIYQLKKAIVEEKRNRFREIDPDELKVYVAMIPDTEEAMESFSFEGLNVLRGSDEIDEHFPKGFTKKTIHIAIKPPGKQHLFIISTHIC
jgi:hypothetical protein